MMAFTGGGGRHFESGSGSCPTGGWLLITVRLWRCLPAIEVLWFDVYRIANGISLDGESLKGRGKPVLRSSLAVSEL